MITKRKKQKHQKTKMHKQTKEAVICGFMELAYSPGALRAKFSPLSVCLLCLPPKPSYTLLCLQEEDWKGLEELPVHPYMML